MGILIINTGLLIFFGIFVYMCGFTAGVIQEKAKLADKYEKISLFLEDIGLYDFEIKKDGTFKFKAQMNNAKGHLFTLDER